MLFRSGLACFRVDSDVWSLIHVPSGMSLGSFRTLLVARRAAQLHNEIGVDFTLPLDDLRSIADVDHVVSASIAACAIAVAEDELRRLERDSDD